MGRLWELEGEDERTHTEASAKRRRERMVRYDANEIQDAMHEYGVNQFGAVVILTMTMDGAVEISDGIIDSVHTLCDDVDYNEQLKDSDEQIQAAIKNILATNRALGKFGIVEREPKKHEDDYDAHDLAIDELIAELKRKRAAGETIPSDEELENEPA